MMITNSNNTSELYSNQLVTAFDIDTTSRIVRKSSKNVPLGDDFVPSNYDVLCGRGKESFNHVGNRRFRVTIAMNLKHYMEAKTKIQKTLVVVSIVDTIRALSPNGGFVKQGSDGKWYEIGDKLARAKVGHALRDLIVSLKRSEERKASKGKQLQSKEAILSQMMKQEEAYYSSDNTSTTSSSTTQEEPDSITSSSSTTFIEETPLQDSSMYEPISIQEESSSNTLEEIPISNLLMFDENKSFLEPDPISSNVHKRTSALHYLDSVVQGRRVSYDEKMTC